MAQIEINKKDLTIMMTEGLLVEQMAEKLGVSAGGIKAAAKAFGLNLRKKPTTRTPKYVFVDDTTEDVENSPEVLANVTDVKSKKVKESKITEEQVTVNENNVNASNFVNTLLGKESNKSEENNLPEENVDFGL